MELIKQVCSLKLAKRLKELGVPQESLCYWCDIPVITPPQYELQVRPFPDKRVFSAFTVAELGLMLPDRVVYGDVFLLTVRGTTDFISYEGANQTLKVAGTQNGTEADARAKILLYLLESRLFKADSPSEETKEPPSEGRE